MLEEILKGYKTTGEIPKLKKVPAIILSGGEQAALNGARSPAAPKLNSPVLTYNGKHHFNSRGPTDIGNNYPNSEMLAQLDNVSSQELGLLNEHSGPALQALTARKNAAGQSINDVLVVGVDSSGKGEVFSVKPYGDRLKKGQKAHAGPFGSGDRAQPEVGIPKGTGAAPLGEI